MADMPTPVASRPTTASSSTTHVTGAQSAAQNVPELEVDLFNRAKIMFSGPDGLRDHCRKPLADGGQTASREGTGSLAYLVRCPAGTPFAKPKHDCIGEIGWQVRQLTLDGRLRRRRRRHQTDECDMLVADWTM